jgi:phage terminase small subunit
MPVLKNPRHERFAHEIAKGKSLAEAHALAGFAGDRGNAWRLQQRNDIGRRINEIRTTGVQREAQALEKACEKLAITKERILDELAKIGFADLPGAPKWSDKLIALQKLGQELGLFVERTENTHTLTLEELVLHSMRPREKPLELQATPEKDEEK